MSSLNCPCQSALQYCACCQPYHLGQAQAATAEILMRARYSAYVQGAIDFLVASTLPAVRTSTLWIDYESTHKSINWIGLKVLRVQQGSAHDKIGKVEFRADYLQAGVQAIHHELSRFRRFQGNWCYVDGIISQ
jgi:SEC-C motif domain protein